MRWILAFLLLFAGGWLWSQSLDLTDFNARRLQKQRSAMLVLGAWSVVNIGAGLALRGQDKTTTHHFHTMNAAWNTVNLAIAGFGYWSASRSDPGSFDLFSTIDEQYKFQKILLFNAGLDVGYMATGLFLIERSRHPDRANPARLKGFGQSLLLQGGFLFAFDLVNYWIHARQNGQIPGWLEGLSFTGQGLHWSIIF
ncbi:MAG: hypothetical protein KDC54_10270 [Lewinella sp.]|nr:hypothetical protein [Lewinella sp.]